MREAKRKHGLRKVRVGDVLHLDRQMISIDSEKEYVSVGVRSFGKGVFHYPPRPGAELGKLRFFEIKPGCLFISNIKAWEGAVAIATRQEAGCIASNRFLPYFGDPEEVSISYLQYYFAVGPGLDLLQMASPGSADRNRTLSMSQFEKLRFPLPPLSEQKKIADILSSVDEAIQATEAVIEQTRRVKQGLLQDLLTRGIGHTRFKQTEIGEIPSSWQVRTLNSLGLVDCGKAKNKRQTAPERPYLRVANVLDDEINPEDVLTMPFRDDEFDQYKLESGDILLNEGQSLELVGRPAVYRGTPANVAMQNALLRWRPDKSMVDPDFGYQCIRLMYRTGVFSQVATQTTSIAHLGLGRFRALRIAVPPLREQQQLAAILNAADEPRRAQEAALGQLQQVKAGLLQDLLTGKVRVSA